MKSPSRNEVGSSSCADCRIHHEQGKRAPMYLSFQLLAYAYFLVGFVSNILQDLTMSLEDRAACAGCVRFALLLPSHRRSFPNIDSHQVEHGFVRESKKGGGNACPPPPRHFPSAGPDVLYILWFEAARPADRSEQSGGGRRRGHGLDHARHRPEQTWLRAQPEVYRGSHWQHY